MISLGLKYFVQGCDCADGVILGFALAAVR